jgi:hypothetical protein
MDANVESIQAENVISTIISVDPISIDEVSEILVAIADIVEHKVVVEETSKLPFRGKVVDESGAPVVGVSITEKGTNQGTISDMNGAFNLLLSTDSSILVANFLGYKPMEINPSDTNQTVTLKPDESLLSEVVVIGYGAQKKSSMVGALSSKKESDTTQIPFGEKEFQAYCKQNANKTVCTGKNTSVTVTLYIDETGKPTKIDYKNYSCEEAKKEIGDLLASSPVWTKKNRKVTMTIKW